MLKIADITDKKEALAQRADDLRERARDHVRSLTVGPVKSRTSLYLPGALPPGVAGALSGLLLALHHRIENISI